MRNWLLVVVFLGGSLVCLAQSPGIPQLKQELQNEQRDSARCRLLYTLAFEYHAINPDSGLIMAQQALDIAKKINSPRLQAGALNMMASCWYAAGNFAKALEQFFEALEKSESLKATQQQGSILTNISNVYAELDDHRNSIRFLNRAMEIDSDSLSDYVLAVRLMNFADSYIHLGILDSALFYNTKGTEYVKKINNIGLMATSYCNFGDIYFKMKEPGIALGNYRSSCELLRGGSDYLVQSQVAMRMANLFKSISVRDSALYYARTAYSIADKQGFAVNRLEATSFLSTYYEELNKMDSAYRYMGISMATKDSLYNSAKTRRMQDLMIQEAIRQQQLDAAKQQEAQERKANIQYAIIAITVISFILIFMALSRSIIVNERWLKFLGLVGLLLVFEFINLVLHPFLADITHHSPVWMLLIMVGIAAFLVPIHHRLEHFIRHILTKKNKQMRLQAARRTIAELEDQVEA